MINDFELLMISYVIYVFRIFVHFANFLLVTDYTNIIEYKMMYIEI